jgi:hypothetical protein
MIEVSYHPITSPFRPFKVNGEFLTANEAHARGLNRACQLAVIHMETICKDGEHHVIEHADGSASFADPVSFM